MFLSELFGLVQFVKESHIVIDFHDTKNGNEQIESINNVSDLQFIEESFDLSSWKIGHITFCKEFCFLYCYKVED